MNQFIRRNAHRHHLRLLGFLNGQNGAPVDHMNIKAKAGEFVNRQGVYSPVPDADKIKFVEMDDLGESFYADKRNEFQKLYLR